jgi:hypothetical protein
MTRFSQLGLRGSLIAWTSVVLVLSGTGLALSLYYGSVQTLEQEAKQEVTRVPQQVIV